MYLTHLKTVLSEALKQTFDAEYPIQEFRNLHVSIEFPNTEQDYPGIWVDYQSVGNLQVVGVGHQEYADPSGDGSSRLVKRWRFQGEASFTLVAMSAFERDRLYDEVTRIMAFGDERSSTNEFRAFIEDNPYLAVNFDFDEIGTRGMASSLGTPWQSDDMIYEVEVVMECFGEFVSDALSETLLPFDSIVVHALGPADTDTTGENGWITG